MNKRAILVAVALVAAAVGATSPPTAAKTSGPTFNPNLLLPGSAGAAEPSIRTNSLGQSFVIGPTGLQCQAMRVSHDGSTAKFIGAPDHNAGGGDCDWAVGPEETSTLPTFPTPTADDLAFSSLDNLLNITTGKSSDDGNTFISPNPASTQVVGDDRMWMAADPKLNSAGFDTIYMTFHDITVDDIELSISSDGGFTYTQNAPIINATDVPQGQWQGLGALAGNELGNIVARRDPATGHLTLYSIFATPDSATDNVNQGAAGTNNYNRIYEAVGTVTDPSPPALIPTISWRNYEVFHGPLGARLNRIFPVTTVDSAGRVYAFWADGNHIFTKSDATGTGWNPAASPVTIPNIGKVNTAIMPWAAAMPSGGAAGVVDAVFYGASGGKGTQPNPQDDPNNVWNAYMAQTTNGGATWTTVQASDHVIHTGAICIDGLNCNLVGNRDRTLLDFFQVAVDPTNGAATIAYADDHLSPGSPVMYYTRQCTGTSARTGTALVNDCVAPAPPPAAPQGNSCPGPQVADFTGDAPNNYPGGSGQNMDNFDIVSATFGTSPTDPAGTIDVKLQLKDLEAPPTVANPNIVSGLWTVFFQFGSETGSNYWFVQATTTGTGTPPVGQFVYGTSDGTNFNPLGNIAGDFNPGPGGTFVFHLPRAAIGSPSNHKSLTNLWASTHVSITALGAGVYFRSNADRAPDSGFGSNYVVGTNPPC